MERRLTVGRWWDLSRSCLKPVLKSATFRLLKYCGKVCHPPVSVPAGPSASYWFSSMANQPDILSQKFGMRSRAAVLAGVIRDILGSLYSELVTTNIEFSFYYDVCHFYEKIFLYF